MDPSSTPTIELVRNALYGPALKRTLDKKRISKYQLSKATGVAYQTICLWARGAYKPSVAKAILVGAYLGLINPTDTEIEALREQAQTILNRIDALTKTK
jgi:DNA-binding XRE family transcriptional regulator